MTDVKYTEIDNEAKLLLARDTLRGLESDHFRLSLRTTDIEPNRDARLETLAQGIKALQKEVAALEKK